MSDAPSSFPRIWKVVAAISRGRVMTYGEVAKAAGFTHGARLGGRAMHAAKGLPWHRVVAVARKGRAKIALHDPALAELQRVLLRRERVRVDEDGTIDLEKYGVGAPAPRGRRA
jgi:methylated-DNA-protein-cysteine methyltransferase-like protein